MLASPLDGPQLRAFVIGGPVGLAIAIVLSLWVSYMHVRHTAIVQVETRWQPGETLGIRAQIVAEQPGPVDEPDAESWVEQAGERHALDPLQPTGDSGVLQGTLAVPSLQLGPAELHVRLVAQGVDPMHEVVPVEIVADRGKRDPTHLVAGSILQYGDDTDPQPPGVRIDLRPEGRILAGFENTLFVRVLKQSGEPWVGLVAVRLVDGELAGKKGSFDGGPESPLLVQEEADALGLVTVSGRLDSEVLRIEVQVLDHADPARVLHRRRLRMVSYAGGVHIEARPQAIRPGQAVEVTTTGLSKKRSIFVDAHDPEGAFIDTFQPPMSGAEPPRAWSHPSLGPGLVQLEAYHFTNAPGESTAIARLQVVDEDPEDPASLRPLLAAHREALSVPRVERDFDPALERAYLDFIEKAASTGDVVQRARRFLLGTLPVAVYGPPTALVTREREHAAMEARKRRWTIGLRIFLLGGGGLFLAAMTLLMVRAHGRVARSTLRELERLTPEAHVRVAAEVARARRAALLRGMGMVAVMAAGLVVTTVMLESLVWVH